MSLNSAVVVFNILFIPGINIYNGYRGGLVLMFMENVEIKSAAMLRIFKTNTTLVKTLALIWSTRSIGRYTAYYSQPFRIFCQVLHQF